MNNKSPVHISGRKSEYAINLQFSFRTEPSDPHKLTTRPPNFHILTNKNSDGLFVREPKRERSNGFDWNANSAIQTSNMYYVLCFERECK